MAPFWPCYRSSWLLTSTTFPLDPSRAIVAYSPYCSPFSTGTKSRTFTIFEVLLPPPPRPYSYLSSFSFSLLRRERSHNRWCSIHDRDVTVSLEDSTLTAFSTRLRKYTCAQTKATMQNAKKYYPKCVTITHVEGLLSGKLTEREELSRFHHGASSSSVAAARRRARRSGIARHCARFGHVSRARVCPALPSMATVSGVGGPNYTYVVIW